MSMDTPAPPVNVPGDGKLMCRFKTSAGDIEAVLYEAEVPRTVANFVALATGAVEWERPDGSRTSDALYTGTVFHRVIPDFMIQGGCPRGDGRGDPGYRFADEIAPGLVHSEGGMLSMANSGANTNGSQFFITEVATPHLDGKHSIFGYCEPLQVVKDITHVPTARGNRPLEPIVLKKLSIHRGSKPQ